MSLRGLLHRIRVLIAPASYAREVDAEIRFHLELDAMQARTKGHADADAESLARRQFGNMTSVREEVRRASGIELLDRVQQDLTYAIRGLRRAPGFTAAVVLTLALGLGVNSAMFTFLDRVFVKPPAAVVLPEQIRRGYIDVARPTEPNGRHAFPMFLYPQIREIARDIDSGTTIGIFWADHDTVGVRVGANVISVRRALANTAYFRVLGIRPRLGNLFDADADRVETPAAVAIISHDLWQRAFNSDAQAIGATIWIQDKPVTVVGVAADHFTGIELDRVDLWMPINNHDFDSTQTHGVAWYNTYNSDFNIVLRLPTAAAEQRFDDIATRAYRSVTIPVWYNDTTAFVRTGPILSALGPEPRNKEVSISLRLGGVALIVLLIAVANVSNLLLLRATKRGREIAVRRALGVTRARLFEQLFTEALLLAAIGGAVAILIAFWAGSALRHLLLPSVEWASGPLDFRAVIFAGAATLGVGLLVGIAPAVHAWRPDLIASLKSGSRDGAYRRSRLRSSLLVAQAALSVVLLVGAALFVRSLRNVQAIDVGYDVDRIITAAPMSATGDRITPPTATTPALIRRLSAIDGVEAVASATVGPMLGASYTSIAVPGRDSLPWIGDRALPSFIEVTPGYFRVAGIRVLAGHVFSEGNVSGVVVSNAMAKAYWPGESAMGKCVIKGGKASQCVPVIGVVEDVHAFNIIEGPNARYYIGNAAAGPTIVLRVSADHQAAVAKLVAGEVKAMVPQAAYVRIRSMSAELEPQFRPWRLGATLFTVMGLLALILAAIGVYSVIAYAVSQRTNEMGIRIALGAQVSDITRLVMGDGLRTVAIGIGLGVIASLAMGRLVASLLFGISPRDPAVMIFSALVLAAIGLAASVIPALRAARVDPVTSLRVD
jgi:putative ABC transport system permease protein